MTDLTVALIAHDETAVAGPTMRSAELAIAHARAAGLTVERRIGLDTPTPETLAYFCRFEAEGWTLTEHAFRDQGRTRNAVVEAAQGRNLAFLDADDLFSENWLARAAAVLDEEGEGADVIVHPELHWQFDAIQNVNASPDQADPFFSPYVMSAANYYDALCMAPRRAWLANPYPHRDMDTGYAFEDYQWFVEMTALGWRHRIARDTIIFKRRRDASQHNRARKRVAMIRAVEPLAIDKVGQMVPRSADGA